MGTLFDVHDLILQFELIQENVDPTVLLARLEVIRHLQPDCKTCKFIIDAFSMELHSALTSLEKARKYYEECEEFLTGDDQLSPLIEYRYLIAVANFQFRQERTDLGIKVLKRALKFAGTVSNQFLSAKLDSEVYHQLGVLHSILRHYELAIPYYMKVIEIDKEYLGQNSFGHAATLDQAGLSFLGIGDWEGSKSYFSKAEELKGKLISSKKQKNESHKRESISLAYTLGNLADLHVKMKKYEIASHYLERCLGILKREKDSSVNFAIFLLNAAHVNRRLGRFEEAKKLFRENINFFESYDAFGKSALLESKLMFYLFLAWIGENENLIANLTDLQNSEGINPYQKANINYEIAKEYIQKNKLDDAKSYLLKSMEFLNLSRRKGLLKKESSLAGGHDRFKISETANKLAAENPFLFEFEELVKVIEIGIDTITVRLKILPSESDLKVFLSRANVFFDSTLNNLIGFLDTEFSAVRLFLQVSELSRNYILRQKYEMRRLIEERYFESSLSKQFTELIRNISLLERSLAIARAELKAEEIRLELNGFKYEYRELLQTLAKDGFRFSAILNDEKFDVDRLLKFCHSDRAVVRFLITSCSLVVFVFSGGKVNHKVVINRNQSKLDELRSLIIDSIGNLNRSYEDFKEELYVSQFAYLGEILWLPIQEYLVGLEKVKIVADLWLNIVPFDGIITNVGETLQDSTFLIDRFELEYCTSLQNVVFDRQRNTQQTNNLLFLAPLANDIPTDREEAEQLKKLLNKSSNVGDFYFNNGCEKSMISDPSSKYKVLHLSSHGFASDKNRELCGIRFQESSNEGDLFPSDIAGKSVKFDLVFLSCCETGVGPIGLNEGVLGIYRSFYLAGAENVVYTLFKVPDHGTSKLTIMFYRNIYENSESFTSALARAKREIRRNKFSTPQSWCGLSILTG